VKKSVPKQPKKIKTNPLEEYRSFLKGDKTVELLTLGDDDLLSTVKTFISTQSLVLDKTLRVPGIPCGRITEIVGDEHTGKSTLLDHMLAETQRIGGVAILVDPEQGRDARYTRSIGVNADNLIVAQMKIDSLEDVFNFASKTIKWWRAHHPDVQICIGVDSIGGLPTREDLKREAGELKPGDAAKVIKHALRVFSRMVAESHVALVFVNHFYEQIGKMFGDKRASYGGRGIRYHASVRLQLDRGEALKDPYGRPIGHIAHVKVLKSKVSGASLARCDVPIVAGRGIDNVLTLFTTLQQAKLIVNQQGSSWYAMQFPGMEEPVKWQGGWFGLDAMLREKPELYAKMVDYYRQMP
jgi:recombination protein RecA